MDSSLTRLALPGQMTDAAQEYSRICRGALRNALTMSDRDLTSNARL